MFKTSALITVTAALLALSAPSHSEAGLTIGTWRPPVIVVKPDLHIVYAQRHGDTIYILVHNQGLGNAGMFKVRRGWGADQFAFVLRQETNVSGLAAGGYKWLMFDEHPYVWWKVIVDTENWVKESNEYNNQATGW